jgi:hypothetical protein
MDSFLDGSSGALSTELGWPLLIQKLICFDDRVLHKLATDLLLFLHSRNLTETLPHLKIMRVELLNLGDLNSLKYLITWVLRGLLLLLLLEQVAEKWLTQGWFWDNLLLIFSSLSSFLFSLLLSFSLLFPLEDSIKEYYHHTEEETEDYEPCTTVFNPRITKHCDLRGKGVENGVACYLAGGFYLVCFCFGWELRELVGGGIYRRVGVARVRSGVMEQVTQGSKHDKGRGLVLPAVVALQRGSGAVVVRMEVGTRAGGTGEWWGQWPWCLWSLVPRIFASLYGNNSFCPLFLFTLTQG